MAKATYGFAIGMPTDVDVDRLVETFGVPVVGAIIAYQEVESTLRLARSGSRFRTVTSAWRRKLEREHNLLLDAVPNQGFRVLTNKQRVGYSSRHFKLGLRKTAIAGRRAATTSRADLDASDSRVLDYVSNTAAQFKLQAALDARKMRELPPGTS